MIANENLFYVAGFRNSNPSPPLQIQGDDGQVWSDHEDAFTLLEMMRGVTGEEPVLWESSIVGFDCYHYEYESEREGDMPLIGFSPRKHSMTLYFKPGLEKYEAILADLGKHKIGKSCWYVNKLADADEDVHRSLVSPSYDHM